MSAQSWRSSAGAIENLVGWVKGSFFKQRHFVDAEDLQAQLREWLVEVNTLRPSRATGVIPAVRRAEELARLRPLKVVPNELALRLPIVVGPTGYVQHATHRYSMPPDAIGIAGTLYLYRTSVRIVAGDSKRPIHASRRLTRSRRCRRTGPNSSPRSRGSVASAISSASISSSWGSPRSRISPS